jgi:hypothetical protein
LYSSHAGTRSVSRFNFAIQAAAVSESVPRRSDWAVNGRRQRLPAEHVVTTRVDLRTGLAIEFAETADLFLATDAPELRHG